VSAQRLARVGTFSRTHSVASGRPRLNGDNEIREGSAFRPRQIEHLLEDRGRFGVDDCARAALPAEAKRGISDVFKAESAVNHIKVQHCLHLIACEENVAGAEIGVKPATGKPCNDSERQIPGRCRPPIVEEIQFWFDACSREHAAQGDDLLLAVCPPPEQVRDRVVLHRLGGEAGPGSVDAR